MAYGNASKKTVPQSALSSDDLDYIAKHINTAYGEKILGLEKDIELLKESGGGVGNIQIMFVEIAEIFESDHFRYEFARPFEEIRDWLMNGGYVIGKVGSEDICGITYYATAWDADTVWFSNFIKATSASTSEHTELIFSQDESVEIRSHSLVGEEAISADNEDFKTAVLNCFPDADTMSFPLEETVSEVSVE